MMKTILAVLLLSAIAVAQEPPQPGDLLIRDGLVWKRVGSTWVALEESTPTTTPPTSTTSTSRTTSTSSSSSSSTSTSTSSSAVTPAASTTSIATPVPTTTTIQTTGSAFYVSVDGSDSNPGTVDKPLKTLVAAAGKAFPGDHIVLRDNQDAEGRMAKLSCGGSAKCGTGGSLRCGTATAPITIRAEHERQAAFISDGSAPAFELAWCRYVNLVGLAARSKDNAGTSANNPHTVWLHDSDHLGVTRFLAMFNNRCRNAHVFRTDNVSDSFFIENEVHGNSRHAFSGNDFDRNFVARNWLNNLGVTASSACPISQKSLEGIALYPGFGNVVVNNLIEGAAGWGIVINGLEDSYDNVIAGNAIVGTHLGMKMFTRPNYGGGIGNMARTILRDNVIANTTGSFMVRDSITKDTLYERMTGFNNAYGFTADTPTPGSTQVACGDVSGGPSFTLKSSIITGSKSGPDVNVNGCADTPARHCTLTSVRAKSYGGIASTCAGSGGDECLCTDKGTAIPADLGDSGPGKCLVKVLGDLGADVRCVLGPAKGARTSDSLWDAKGQFRFCGAKRAGWNDGAERCDNFAARRLNHKTDGSGCPLSRVICS